MEVRVGDIIIWDVDKMREKKADKIIYDNKVNENIGNVVSLFPYKKQLKRKKGISSSSHVHAGNYLIPICRAKLIGGSSDGWRIVQLNYDQAVEFQKYMNVGYNISYDYFSDIMSGSNVLLELSNRRDLDLTGKVLLDVFNGHIDVKNQLKIEEKYVTIWKNVFFLGDQPDRNSDSKKTENPDFISKVSELVEKDKDHKNQAIYISVGKRGGVIYRNKGTLPSFEGLIAIQTLQHELEWPNKKVLDVEDLKKLDVGTLIFLYQALYPGCREKSEASDLIKSILNKQNPYFVEEKNEKEMEKNERSSKLINNEEGNDEDKVMVNAKKEINRSKPIEIIDLSSDEYKKEIEIIIDDDIDDDNDLFPCDSSFSNYGKIRRIFVRSDFHFLIHLNHT